VSPITLARNDGLGGLKGGMDLARRFYPLPKDARLRKGAALDSCWPVCSRLLVEFCSVAGGGTWAKDRA